MSKPKMKPFPLLIHAAYEPDVDGCLIMFTDGVASMDPTQRCAIYKLVDEGFVRGPKSFVSTRKGRKA